MSTPEWDPVLYIWTVFDKGTDGNDHEYTARMFAVERGETRATGDVMHSVDLDYLRRLFERMGLIRFVRTEEDPPNIIESWL